MSSQDCNFFAVGGPLWNPTMHGVVTHAATVANNKLTLDTASAVRYMRGPGSCFSVYDPHAPGDPKLRVSPKKLNDDELAGMIELEIRTLLRHGQAVTMGPALDINPIIATARAKTSPLVNPTNPLDLAASAVGLSPQEYPTMNAPDLAKLMANPAELGAFLGNAVATINEIPKLRAQMNDLQKSIDAAKLQKTADDKQITELTDELVDTRERLQAALTKASQAGVSAPTNVGKGNDLDVLARALHITRKDLDAEIASFLVSCSLPLCNPVRWPAWCDPSQKGSFLPFCFRNSKPVFLAGPSGTGKTFLAEALCHNEMGRRCSVTFHEKISYAKLFHRETVTNGVVRGVLGPILLACITGTPIVLDEIDHADVFVQSLMHELLDKRRVFIPELAMSICAEDTCRFIATGNSLTDDTGQYHGDVGTALRTRFAAIHVEYPDLDTETETVATASGCNKSIAQTIAKTFQALRNAEAEQKLAGPISVREACAVGTLFVQGQKDKLKEDDALALALSLMVVQKRPPSEQLTAAEICAATARVPVGSFQQKVSLAAGKSKKAGAP